MRAGLKRRGFSSVAIIASVPFVASTSTWAIVSNFIVWFSVVSLIVPVRIVPAAEGPMPDFSYRPGRGMAPSTLPNLPWTQSGEPIPKEVKDKEKETPVSVCTWERRLLFSDNPGTEKLQKQFSVSYKDGTRVIYDYFVEYPIGAPERRILTTGSWSIYIPDHLRRKETEIRYGPVQGLIAPPERIIYEPGKERRVEEWREYREYQERRRRQGEDSQKLVPSAPDAPPGKQGSILVPADTNKLVNVSDRLSGSSRGAMGESLPDFMIPFALAATATQQTSSTQTRETPEEPQHNMKVVTVGGPPSDPVVVFFEPPPQTTPEDFVQNPPGSTWDPSTDPQGPSTTTPGPDGIPLTGIPVGYVNIGSGWASERVHSSGLTFCSDGPLSGITTENRQDRAQANLPDGGEVVVAPHYGWIYLPDGTHVDRWKNGAKTISRRNGFGMTFLPESGWGLTLPDRTSITIHNQGATVRFPDGKTITRKRNGNVVEERPDGTEAPLTGKINNIKLPGGGELDMSSGYTAIIKTPDGTEIRTLHGEGGSLTQVTSPDGSQITATDDGQIILTRPGQPEIKMEKDGETIISPGGREPTVRLKTNGMVDVVPFGGRIY